jgi:putative endonuclease
MREDKRYYVYIMASRSLTLYTGVTGDLYHRALQHKAGEIEGFTKKYHITRLVYYENIQIRKRKQRHCARKGSQNLDGGQTPRPDQVDESDLARPGRRLG